MANKALLGLIGAAAVGVGLYLLMREKGPKWQAGDEIFCWVKNGVWNWAAFTIIDVAEHDGVLSYYMGEGHPPDIIDYYWLPVSEVDKLNCRET